MASQEYQKFLAKLFSKRLQPPASIEEARDNFEQWLSSYPAAKDVQMEPLQEGALQGLWVKAPKIDPNKVVLFFHGGGFCLGSPRSHQDLMGRISQHTGVAVLGIAYRKAPENPFPAALEDAITSYNWLLSQGYASEEIALAGSSSGGGLCLSLMLALKEKGQPMPACAVLICPWVDLTMTGDSMVFNEGKDMLSKARLEPHRNRYVGNFAQDDPLVSPLFGELSGLPPLFIQIGQCDLLYSETVALAKKAKQAGVETLLDEWPEMVHTFPFFAKDFPEAREAIERAGKFIAGKLSKFRN